MQLRDNSRQKVEACLTYTKIWVFKENYFKCLKSNLNYHSQICLQNVYTETHPPINSVDEHISNFRLNKKVTFQVSFVFNVLDIVETVWFLVFTVSRTSRIFKVVFMCMILVFQTISLNINLGTVSF